MLVLKSIYKLYNYLSYDLADHRSDSLFLMSSPIYPILVIVIYLKFILYWGPKWMQKRQPFNLEKVLIVYNIVQIYFSIVLLVKAIRYTYVFGGYSWICEPVDTSTSPTAITIMKGCHMYFLIKILDLLDTVFFILRKKSNQVSFLHVYHHAGMVFVAWCGVRYLPGGQSIFVGFLNSFVHAVMYSYYLLSAMKPENKDAILWWKKHLTQMQIAQFMLIALNWLALCIHPYCGYPKLVGFIMLPQNFFVTLLFIDFYIKAYVRKRKN